jgi:uncharacterized protein (DUF1778 family)
MVSTHVVEQEKGRITARVSTDVQATLQRAADLTGVPLSSFIVQVVLKEAHELIDRYEMKNISFSEKDSMWLLGKLAEPRPPTTRLKKALVAYEEDAKKNAHPGNIQASEKRTE